MAYLPYNSLVGDLAVVITLLILVASVQATVGTESGAEISFNKRNVIATGIGRRTVTTSIASIRISVEDHKSTAIEAQRSVANKTTKLLAYLNATETGVDNLQTTGIALSPQLDYSKSPANITGYDAKNTVSFEVPILRSGNVLDSSVKSGATRIIGVDFRATSKVSRDARLNAIEDAVENATAEARAAARAAGLKIDKAIHIRMDDTFHQVTIEQDHIVGRNHLKSSESAPSTPIVPQQQVIEARATVTFLAI